MKEQELLHLSDFCKKYGVSQGTIIKLMKKNYIILNVHYKIEFQLHQNKRLILNPDEVYNIILDRSSIVRKKKNVQKNKIRMSTL